MNVDTDVQHFLTRELPGLIATVATNGRDGYPLVIPVWYRWNGEEILVWSLESRRWVQNVVLDAKVGVSIQEDGSGSMAVIMRGSARVETSDAPSIDEEIMRITRRYVPESKIADYFDGWEHLRTIVHIKPKSLYIWR
jgi:hypothetical protein